MINCVSCYCNCSVPPDPTGTRLVYDHRGDDHIFAIISKITHFTNRFMQCRQSTGARKLTIQHCILSSKRLTGFLKNLWTSNICSKDITTAKILKYNYDSHDLVQTKTKAKKSEMSVLISKQQKNMNFISNTIIFLYKVNETKKTISSNVRLSYMKTSLTSIKKNNANANNVWSDKLSCTNYTNDKTSGITAYLSRVFLQYLPSHMRQLSLHSCHYFFN